MKDHTISEALNEMYNTEFNEENAEEKGLSIQEELLKIMKKNVRKSDGYYEAPHPFHDDK